MIRKPKGYDEAPAYTGENVQLPKGKYECVIKQVAVQNDPKRGDLFVLLFDVDAGDQKGFYQKLYDADRAQDPKNAKWRGVYKQNMDGKGLSWFKGIITSIERSNNIIFQWDREGNEKQLQGKRFGGVFRRRQFETENGSRPIVTELFRIRSIAGLAEAEVPEDDLLPDTAATKPVDRSAGATTMDGFMTIPEGADDEGIPFL